HEEGRVLVATGVEHARLDLNARALDPGIDVLGERWAAGPAARRDFGDPLGVVLGRGREHLEQPAQAALQQARRGIADQRAWDRAQVEAGLEAVPRALRDD